MINCPNCGAELKLIKAATPVDDVIGLAGEILADEELKDTRIGKIGSRIVGMIGRIFGKR